MKPIRYVLPLILAAIGFLGGCSEPVAPGNAGIPTGIYRYVTSFTEGGVDMRRHSTVMLLSQREGFILDTLYRANGNQWVADSTTSLELAFQGFGNGYHRGVGIHRRGTAIPDTSLSYWQFARRGDSLYIYVGQSYLGNNLGIVGRWKTPDGDTALLGGRYNLNFGADSVTIEGSDPVTGPVAGTYRYRATLDSLEIMNAPVTLGDRYSVTPAWGLYITNRPTHGYGRSSY